jgi:hypothetical protein
MRTELLLDRGERKVIAVSEQDVEPILARNAKLRAEPQRSDWGRHVATNRQALAALGRDDQGCKSSFARSRPAVHSSSDGEREVLSLLEHFRRH